MTQTGRRDGSVTLAMSMSSPPGLSGEDAAGRRLGRRLKTGGRTLRVHTARGTLINGVFQVFLASLTFIQGFVVAAFLSRTDYGIWGILMVGLGTMQWLKGSAVSQKYVQQSAADQEEAFQTAFTMELILTGLLSALMVIALPLLALIYGQWRVVAPGLVMALLLVPISVFETPQWVFYRSMDFLRQRLLGSIDPVIGFIVTVSLAIAGAGYWSMVLGPLVGVLAGAAVTLRAKPYRLKLRAERHSVREYFRFSWPLTIAGGTAMVLAQGSLVITNGVLGLAAVGTVSLASQIAAYTDGVDAIVTGTLYPAICAVQDRIDLLFESFVKSNRLALMWGMPFGVGIAVFAPQIVQFVIGERWHAATGLIQIFGLAAASHQVGFNWNAFFSARGDTRPLATLNTVLMAVFIGSAIPLTIADGLSGMGIAVAVMTTVGLAGRTFYLTRIFPGFKMLRHMLRATAPTAPATAATLLMRVATGPPHSLLAALAELAVYVTVTLIATWAFERELLQEVLGYVRNGGRPPVVPAAVA